MNDNDYKIEAMREKIDYAVCAVLDEMAAAEGVKYCEISPLDETTMFDAELSLAELFVELIEQNKEAI